METNSETLRQSPHDQHPPELLPGDVFNASSTGTRWVPSRYNIRSTTEDGQLILWNTYRGSMSVFKPQHATILKTLLSNKGIATRPEGLLKYLCDRGFLVEEGTDEYRQFQLDFGQQHYQADTLQLIILASEDCNFRCRYCYEQFARGTMLPWVRTGIKKLVQGRLPGLRRLAITWFGGEPLYGFQAIEDLAPYLHETAREHSLSFYAHMTTNGYLLSPEIVTKLLAWRIMDYQITIDGPQKCHDRSRPTRNGRGTFLTIFNNLKALSHRSDEYSVSIRMNFDKHNCSDLVSFLDIAEKEFKDDPRFRFRFRPVRDWSDSNDEALGAYDFDDIEEIAMVQDNLQREALKRGLSIVQDSKTMSKFGGHVCYAARPYSIVIGASGKLMKCTVVLDTKDDNIVGTIAENGELCLDHEKLALWTEPAFAANAKCRRCILISMCQGIRCPLFRIHESRSICPPMRTNPKRELLAIYNHHRHAARKVTVGGMCDITQCEVDPRSCQTTEGGD